MARKVSHVVRTAPEAKCIPLSEESKAAAETLRMRNVNKMSATDEAHDAMSHMTFI